MLNRLTAAYRAAAFAKFLPMALPFLLVACGGGKPAAAPVAPSIPAPMPSSSPTAGSSFGMQCGIDDPADCEGAGGVPAWPTTQAQPGLLRLHDAGTYWATLNPASGSYDWTNLDNWLDLIPQHEPVDVSQVFIWIPCWDAPACLAPTVAPHGTNAPPLDLTSSGSPSFNNFVTQFVQHCSPAGNCVASIIKYYEMWNEWDLPVHWTGTPLQLYQMLAPAAAIIRQNVPNAVILAPSASADSPTYQADLAGWLAIETANTKMSDWVTWHIYLTSSNGTSNTPEAQWANYGANFLTVLLSTPGWSSVPWANTETNFAGDHASLPYACPTPAQFTTADCTGQIVRWQLLNASDGGASLDWYKWNQTIGANPQYETAYYYMMQYMLGGKFTAVCSAATGSETWTCPFTESNGTTALFVWTPSEAGTPYTVPDGYVDYKDFNGGKTVVTAGQQITIGVEPFMLEQ